MTVAAIKALPGMTARRTDGEWRVTYTAAAISHREGVLGAKVAERAEALACYTSDPVDALDTAGAMSRAWYGDTPPAMVNPEIVSDTVDYTGALRVVHDDGTESIVDAIAIVNCPTLEEAKARALAMWGDVPGPAEYIAVAPGEIRPGMEWTRVDPAADVTGDKAARVRAAVDQLAGELAGEGNASAAGLLADAGRCLNTLCDRDAARLADVIAEHPTKAAALAALEAAATPVPDSERHATRTDSEGRQFIDMTPTWEEILGTLLAVYTDGDSEGRKFARGELTRMARLADRYTSAAKALQS